MVSSKSVEQIVRKLGAALFLLLSSQAALAADTALQTVDLSDQGMSTEGGEATLIQLASQRLGRCKIEVVHYGETGRTTYRFIFADKLRYAARREYRYSEPLYSMRRVQTSLSSELLLSSSEGARVLPADFLTYKAFFDTEKLRRCSSAPRR